MPGEPLDPETQQEQGLGVLRNGNWEPCPGRSILRVPGMNLYSLREKLREAGQVGWKAKPEGSS